MSQFVNVQHFVTASRFYSMGKSSGLCAVFSSLIKLGRPKTQAPKRTVVYSWYNVSDNMF